MPVDTSIYGLGPQASPVPPVDPLAQLGKVLQIQQGMVGLAGAQQEFRARQALGPILQQSIDPETGELDINKFLIHGAANPDVAWKMPEITLQMIQRENTQADTVLKGVQAGQDRWKSIGGVALALKTQAMERAGIDPQTGKPAMGRVSKADFVSGFGDLVSSGLLDSKDAAQFISKYAGLTDQQRFQLVSRVADASRDIDKGLDAVHGAVQAYKFGGGTAMTQVSPRLGTANTVGTIEESPTPAERNAQVGIRNQQGQVVQVPRSAMPMQGGMGTPTPGTGTGVPGLMAPAGPGGATPPVSELSPTEQQYKGDAGKNFAEYENTLNTTNQAGIGVKQLMTEMRDALKEFKAGGGLDVRMRLANIAQGIGAPAGLVDKIAGGNLGAIQEFSKLAVQYASEEMKRNMGQGQRFTNLDFGTFLKNNPTINTDPRGLEKMFSFITNVIDRSANAQNMLEHWKQGHRPKGFESSDITSFPTWWRQKLEEADKATRER